MIPIFPFAFASKELAVLGTVGSGLFSLLRGKEKEKTTRRSQQAAELKAKQIELQGRIDAIGMNAELLRLLAYNNAQAAASGLTSISGGTVAAIQQDLIQQNEERIAIHAEKIRMQAEQARLTGKAMKKKGRLSLLEGTYTASRQFKTAYDMYKEK